MSLSKKQKINVSKSTWIKKFQHGFQQAVNEVIMDARKKNRSLAVLQKDGTEALVPARKIKIAKTDS